MSDKNRVRVPEEAMPAQMEVFVNGRWWTLYLQHGQQDVQQRRPHVVVYEVSRAERERGRRNGEEIGARLRAHVVRPVIP